MKGKISGFRISSYLLILTAATLLIISLSYAKYIKKVNGTATAVVALWESASSTHQLDISKLKPGDVKIFTVQITNTRDSNTSEVAQDYSITLKTTENLPLQYGIQGSSTKTGSGTLISTNNKLNFTEGSITMQGGSLPHTDSVTHTYEITVKWPAEKNEAVYADEIDMVTLIVDAKQKQ